MATMTTTIDAPRLMANLTVRVTGYRKAALRLRIASAIMSIGVWIGGFKSVEVIGE